MMLNGPGESAKHCKVQTCENQPESPEKKKKNRKSPPKGRRKENWGWDSQWRGSAQEGVVVYLAHKLAGRVEGRYKIDCANISGCNTYRKKR